MTSGATLGFVLVTKKLVFFEVQIMAAMKGGGYIEGRPKKTRQGSGKHTKLSATSRNGSKKRYRGQGR